MENSINFDKNDFMKSAKAFAEKRSFSGAIALSIKNEKPLEAYFGFADMKSKKPIDESSEFLISIKAPYILSVCIMKLYESKLIKLNDKLSEYLPEYENADKLSVKDLLKGNSKLPDCFYGGKLVEMHSDEEYSSLSEIDKLKSDKLLEAKGFSFREALKQVENKPLDFVSCIPNDSIPTTERVFLRELIERVIKRDINEFISEEIFKPLGIKAHFEKQANTISYFHHNEYPVIKLNCPYPPKDCFCINSKEAFKLLCAFVNGSILKKKSYDILIKCDKNGNALGINNVNGAMCAHDLFMGYECDFYFEPDKALGYMILSNEGERFSASDSGLLTSFFTDIRSYMEKTFTVYGSLTYKPLSYNNLNYAAALTLSDEQRYFVDSVYASFSLALSKRNIMRAFVLSSDNRVVGINVLSADKDNNKYTIEIAIIGEAYQHMGFGKAMLKNGIEYLKKRGAGEISIAVDRMNKNAKALYLSLGFKVCYVQDGWLMLSMRV